MIKLRKYLFPILIIILAFIFYLPTINNNFLSDDYVHLMFARSVDNVHMIPGIFKIPGDVYRPVMNLSIVTDYLIYHYHPTGFHLTNIILFALTALLIYAIVKQISKNNLMSFFASLFFIVIPNHHETVTWIGGRTDLLACFFYLLTIYLFILFIKNFKSCHPKLKQCHPEQSEGSQSLNDQQNLSEKHRISHFVRKDGYLFLILSYLSAIPAFFSKEISMTLPFVLILIYFVYLRKESKLSYKKIILLWIPYIIMLGIYLIIRKDIVGSWIGGYSLFGQSSSTKFSLKSILLQFYFAKYLINFDYLVTFLPKFATNSYANIIAIIEITIIFIASILFNLKNLKTARFWINVIFFIFLMHFVSIPNFSILPSLKLNLMNTRVLYAASIPICIFMSYLFFNDLNKKKIKIAFASLLCLFFAIAFFFNYIPWHKASAKSMAVLNNIQQSQPKFATLNYATYNKEIFFKNLPDNIYGAFVFRNGFEEGLRIKLNNKKIFVNQKEKIVWVVQNSKNPISTLCNFKKNPQTTGIQVFNWNDKENKFVEETAVENNYRDRETIKQKSIKQLTELNQQLNNLAVQQFSNSNSNGKSSFLTSPEINLPSVTFNSFNAKQDSQSGSIADFQWTNSNNEKFNENQNDILIQTKAGDNEYNIDLTKCPVWFTANNISAIKFTPTEKTQKINLENILLK